MLLQTGRGGLSKLGWRAFTATLQVIHTPLDCNQSFAYFLQIIDYQS